MHVVGAALGVVVLGQQPRTLHPGVVALTRLGAARPSEAELGKTGRVGILRGLLVGECIWNAAHVDVEQRTQDLVLVGAHRVGADSLRVHAETNCLEVFGGQSRRLLGLQLDRVHAIRERSGWESTTPHIGERQRQIAVPVALTPQEVVTVAREAAPAGTIATVDAGAHMLVTMPLWHVDHPGELLISSGLATMGFALPAAVAAALARPTQRVICFTGDGGIGMALAELESLARLQLPVTVVVFNDSTLSLIAAKQQSIGHGGPAAVTYRPTDFAAVARAMGMRGVQVVDVDGYRLELHASLVADGPTLLDVAVDPSAYGAVLDAIRGPRASNRPLG